MAKINGHAYEPDTETLDELIRRTLEDGWVVSSLCDQGQHSLCVLENPDDCWCECHEFDH